MHNYKKIDFFLLYITCSNKMSELNLSMIKDYLPSFIFFGIGATSHTLMATTYKHHRLIPCASSLGWGTFLAFIVLPRYRNNNKKIDLKNN